MTHIEGDSFRRIFKELQHQLIQQKPYNVGEWQSQKLDDNPMTQMRELLNVHFEWRIPGTQDALAESVGAHLPWAEDHFQERISGEPLNPPPSNEWWPFAQKSNQAHKSEGEKFSHTYPERMWPKRANQMVVDMAEHDPLRGVEPGYIEPPHYGIRFEYGDLNDVVNLLRKQPNTRQAYLPIWFPEDTGVVHGKRVPCTLGYHFMIRGDELHISYYMRSCDLLRHFQDDVYMAGRLAQHVGEQIDVPAGDLFMTMANLHVFNGDVSMMAYRDDRGMAWNE